MKHKPWSSFIVLSLVSSATLAGCLEPVATVERDFAVGDVTRVRIDDGAGDIEVVGEVGRTTISLTVELRSQRATRRDDDDAEAAIELDYVIDGEVGRIVQQLVDAPDGYALDLIAHVPAELAVEIADDQGDVVIEGVAGVDVRQDRGDLDIHDIAGSVSIRQGSGDIAIDDVGGHIEVFDGSGDITIDGAAADVVIDDGSGDISVRADGNVEIVGDDGGDVDVG